MEEGKERKWKSRWKGEKMNGREKSKEGGEMYKTDGSKEVWKELKRDGRKGDKRGQKDA